MNNRLPNVFRNRKVGVVRNNKEVFYSKEEKKELPKEDDKIQKIIIRKKINDIFNSRNFIYKAKVIITTKEKDMLVEIIHKNNSALLTLNNESIPIDDILDIKLAK